MNCPHYGGNMGIPGLLELRKTNPERQVESMERNKKHIIIAVACIVVAILYFLFPVDFIPDLIVFIGWLDDLFVGILGLVGLAVNIIMALSVLPTSAACTGYDGYGEYREA